MKKLGLILMVAALKCRFTGASVPFTYTSGTNVIKFSSAFSMTSAPAACGTGPFDGEFVLENGITFGALILD